MERYTCSRCGRATTADHIEGWNAELQRGVIVRIMCARCQTPVEDIEAQVNEAFGSIPDTPAQPPDA